jgi:hypothetical protein
MPNSSNLQSQIARKTSLLLLLGVAVWITLLLVGASHARRALDAGAYDIAIGPLLLNQITRTPTGGGHTVSFSFESGLLWYFLTWVVLGIILGYLTAKHKHANS